MIHKIRFTAYWTAAEAERIMTFLDELKEAIGQNYETELRALYQAESELDAKIEEEMSLYVKEDIPF